MKRAQIAMEFIAMSIFGILFVMGIIIVAISLSENAMDNRAREELFDVGKSIQKEFFIAAQVQNGYHRSIDIPLHLSRGEVYEVELSNQSLAVSRNNFFYVYDLPTVSGSLQLGLNTIRL